MWFKLSWTILSFHPGAIFICRIKKFTRDCKWQHIFKRLCPGLVLHKRNLIAIITPLLGLLLQVIVLSCAIFLLLLQCFRVMYHFKYVFTFLNSKAFFFVYLGFFAYCLFPLFFQGEDFFFPSCLLLLIAPLRETFGKFCVFCSNSWHYQNTFVINRNIFSLWHWLSCHEVVDNSRALLWFLQTLINGQEYHTRIK